MGEAASRGGAGGARGERARDAEDVTLCEHGPSRTKLPNPRATRHDGMDRLTLLSLNLYISFTSFPLHPVTNSLSNSKIPPSNLCFKDDCQPPISSSLSSKYGENVGRAGDSSGHVAHLTRQEERPPLLLRTVLGQRLKVEQFPDRTTPTCQQDFVQQIILLACCHAY